MGSEMCIRDSLDAIVVSPETEPVARKINEIREQCGMKPLFIETIEFVLAEDLIRISSTRIRRGEIDTFGRILFNAHTV